MAAPVTGAMPPDLDIGGSWTIRFDAVDGTGATVSNVVVSNARIIGQPTTVEPGNGTGLTLVGPYMLVPGPGA